MGKTPPILIKKDNTVYCTYTEGTFDKEYLESLYQAGYAVYLDNKKLTIKQAKAKL